MTENYVEILEKKLLMGINPVNRVLTRIDSMDLVLTENDGFDPKRPETHFLPWSTWFDPY